jgi:hypothetical protein
MDDDQERCSHCASEAAQRSILDGHTPEGAGIMIPGRTPTALMDPPRVAPMPDVIRYRQPRVWVTPRTFLLLVPVAAIVVAVLAWLGHGPLATQFEDWGIARTPPGELPAQWTPVVDKAGRFEASLPVGATDVFEYLDPAAPANGGLLGKRFETASGISLESVWTDFALPPEAVEAAAATPAGLQELADRYAAVRLSGDRTVVRDAMVGEGRAIDTVYVDGDRGTTRARFVVVDGRLHALVTSGPDELSPELDAAHRRLLSSLDPES